VGGKRGHGQTEARSGGAVFWEQQTSASGVKTDCSHGRPDASSVVPILFFLRACFNFIFSLCLGTLVHVCSSELVWSLVYFLP
jgi:hypothetical protein